MKKFISIIVTILIFILPVIIFILHFLFPFHYLLYVNNKNNSEIITLLESDNIYIENLNKINRIEVWDIRLSRYSNVKIFYNDGEIFEYAIKNEGDHNYNIKDYIENKAFNIDKLLTILNYISFIPIIVVIISFIKHK